MPVKRALAPPLGAQPPTTHTSNTAEVVVSAPTRPERVKKSASIKRQTLKVLQEIATSMAEIATSVAEIKATLANTGGSTAVSGEDSLPCYGCFCAQADCTPANGRSSNCIRCREKHRRCDQISVEFQPAVMAALAVPPANREECVKMVVASLRRAKREARAAAEPVVKDET